MDLPTDHFITYDVNYVRDHKKFAKGVVVFEIASTVAAAGSDVSQGNGKGPALDKPLLLEFGSLYLSANDAPKCHLCQSTGHMRADCPLKKASQLCRGCGKAGHLKANCPNPTCNNCGETGHLKSDCPRVTCNRCGAMGHRKRDCPQPSDKKQRTCLNCGSLDHQTVFCGQACKNCGVAGHNINDCMSGPTSLRATDAATAPGKVDAPDAAASSAAATSPSPKPLDAAGSHPVADGPVDDPDTHVEDSDSVMAEPSDALQLPNNDHLTVQFVTQIIEEHITACGITFQVSYETGGMPTRRLHKTASVRFTDANIAGDVEVDTADVASPVIRRLLRPTTLEHLTRILPQDATTLRLYHIRFVVASDKLGLDARTLLGEYFFVNGDFGPFTPQIHKARDILLNSPAVVVHFFTLGTEWLDGHIASLNAGLQQQRVDNPLGRWWKNRNVNVQLGMQLSVEDRPSYKIPARYQFDSVLEYFTVQFYAAVASLEAVDQNPQVPTVIRLITFPGGADRVYYAAIQMVNGLALRTDSIIDVSFLGEDADSQTSWKGVIVNATPFSSGYDYCAFVFRPRVGHEFAPNPAFAPEHVLSSDDFTTVGDLSEALITAEGIECLVTERVPKVGISREINSLRHLWQGGDSFRIERRIALSNNFIDLPRINYFGCDIAKYGKDSVDNALEAVLPLLDEEQKGACTALKHMTGSVLLIQGPGGVGKSTFLIVLVRYQYRLGSPQQDPARIWVLSPLNRQLDMLAETINNALMEEYEALIAQGRPAKFPIVLRRHMRSTEIKVYKRDAVVQRTAAGIDTRPEYFEEQDDYATIDEDASMLNVAFLLYRTFKASNATGFDKRLQVIDLSEGQWLLRLAGVPDSDGNLHPIADPDRTKYAEFRQYLHRFAIGDNMTQDDKIGLTLAANVVIADLAKKADVILMTPDVVSQTRAHSISAARAVFHDEAGKASELGSVAGFAWSRPYSIQGGLQIQAGDPVPQVLLGDIYQPKPTLGPDFDDPFRHQKSVSLYARLLAAGADTVWFSLQHRFVEDIACLVNTVLPHGQLQTSPTVKDRKQSKLAASFFKDVLRCDRSVAFLAVNGTMQVNEFSQSTYNLVHARRAFWVAMALIDFGFKPSDVGLAVPYTAQLAVYSAALHALKEWCYAQQDGSKWREFAPVVSEIKIFTVDGIQGGQVEFLVYDTTVAGPLKFVRDTARNLLAITRPRAGLIIVGSPRAVHNHYAGDKTFTNTAYYKIEKWCKDNKVFINLENSKRKEHFQQLVAPFDVDETTQRVYRQRTADHTPISYSMDVDFDIAIPDFAGAANIGGTGNHTEAWNEADREGANNNGWGGAGDNNEDDDGGEDVGDGKQGGW
jgi:cellular nucleic acid-binding protein